MTSRKKPDLAFWASVVLVAVVVLAVAMWRAYEHPYSG